MRNQSFGTSRSTGTSTPRGVQTNLGMFLLVLESPILVKILSFIWSKMRTAAREAASQIALRDCSKDCSGGKTINKVLVKEEFNTMKYSFYKKVFVSLEDLMSP